MLRKIIHIDEEKCSGCGLCASACHEGAIEMVDGKAKLVRENFCDGFGDCLPACPTGAIRFETREAPEYDEAAVQERKRKQEENHMELSDQVKETMQKLHAQGGCPGSAVRQMTRQEPQSAASSAPAASQLAQWPCQIKLVPTSAPFFAGAKLLIAADCTAYAYARIHEDFMRGKVTLIGCPKLDDVDYSEKLTRILQENEIKSVTILRMEVPCCGGLQRAAENAIRASGKFLPWHVVTVSIDGQILDE